MSIKKHLARIRQDFGL